MRWTGDLSPRSRRGRRAFTLVELLVVIVIIGILIGLLIPVISIVQARTQEAAMTTEVANLSQALQAFKTQYQTDVPPDFTAFAPGADKMQIDQFLSRIFRYRNPNTDVPRSAAGFHPEQLDNLDPSEALYFWLRGFSSDATNPLFGPLDQTPAQVDADRQPLYDFDKTRLEDLDSDGFPEFYPRFARSRPYVYLAHYNYVSAFLTPAENYLCRTGTKPAAAFPCPRPYLSTTENPTPDPTITSSYAQNNTFQLLCAGLDSDFGLQVFNDDPAKFLPFAFPRGPYPDKAHKDNITNFAEGTLEGRLE